MQRRECGACGYVHSESAGAPEVGIAPSTRWTICRTSGRDHVAATFAKVRLIVVVTGSLVYPVASPKPRYTYSATYAAAQNLIGAASTFGLGAAFTTLHEVAEPAFRSILGIPSEQIIAVTIPIGWPARPLGPARRKPVESVVHHDRW